MTENVEIIIDFRDSLSSIALLKVTQVFEKMKPSDVLEIRGADSDTLQDIFRLLPVNTLRVVGHDYLGREGEFSRVRITKR